MHYKSCLMAKVIIWRIYLFVTAHLCTCAEQLPIPLPPPSSYINPFFSSGLSSNPGFSMKLPLINSFQLEPTISVFTLLFTVFTYLFIVNFHRLEYTPRERTMPLSPTSRPVPSTQWTFHKYLLELREFLHDLRQMR